jgi:hypothetical protein
MVRARALVSVREYRVCVRVCVRVRVCVGVACACACARTCACIARDSSEHRLSSPTHLLSHRTTCVCVCVCVCVCDVNRSQRQCGRPRLGLPLGDFPPGVSLYVLTSDDKAVEVLPHGGTQPGVPHSLPDVLPSHCMMHRIATCAHS